ncbi:MAG: cell division protein SepF [Clostridia bacterium]|nr:cell division protein SepF [Clostridia bacterium]
MGFMDKLKNLAKITDTDYFDENEDLGYDGEYVEDDYDAPEYPVREREHESVQPEESFSRRHVNYQSAERDRERETGRVVDLHSGGRSQVVFKKLDKFDDAGAVADVLNEKKIVILNLETCPNDISRRVLDFLYGVAYANNGEIKRVAGRAYIITPYNVPVSGEMLDEIENNTANL